MKNSILVVLLALSISSYAQDNATFKQNTIDFIKLTGTAEAFDDAISQIGMMVPESKKESYLIEAEATLSGLYDKLAEVYMKEFTENEIKELVDFYETDLGKKLASKQMSLTQQGMMIGQGWGMEVQQIAQKYSN